MGCGGSKEEVVVGNTLQVTRKKTNTVSNNNDDSNSNNSTAPAAVKDVIGMVEMVEMEEDTKEMTVMLSMSPDLYFSSRKDHDVLASVEVDSTGYQTPSEDQDDHNSGGERKAEGVHGEGGGDGAVGKVTATAAVVETNGNRDQGEKSEIFQRNDSGGVATEAAEKEKFWKKPNTKNSPDNDTNTSI